MRTAIDRGCLALLLAGGALLWNGCDSAKPVVDARVDQKISSDGAGVLCGGAVCGTDQICCGPAACGHCVPKNSGVYCPPTCPDAKGPDAKGPDGKPKLPDAVALEARPPDKSGAQTPCGPSLSCATASQICVIKEAWTKTYSCEAVPAGCDAQRTCACAGKTLCIGSFNLCMDTAGTSNTITCECPTC